MTIEIACGVRTLVTELPTKSTTPPKARFSEFFIS